MWFRTLFDSLDSRGPRTPARRPAPRPVRRRAAVHQLQVETLEDRWLPSSYALTDLGTLSASGGYSTPSGINASGQVVGTAVSSISTRAFLWTNWAMIDLGTLGGQHSTAWAINDLGQVAGAAHTVGSTAWHAFLLTPEDTDGDGSPDRWFRDVDSDGANDLMTALEVPPGTTISEGYDINRAGQVVGYAWDAAGRYRALLWTAGQMTDLGTLGGENSSARGINDSGQVVGFAQDAAARQRPFLWDGGHGMTDLGSASGYLEAQAYAINSSGSIVGEEYDSVSGAGRPFVWTPNQPNGTAGTSTTLDPLPGDSSSSAKDINDAGLVVGSSSYTWEECWLDNDGTYPNTEVCQTFSSARAVLWENGVATDLNGLLLDNAGVHLEEVSRINAAGQILSLDWDSYSSKHRAFLLTPSDGPTISVSDVTVTEGNTGNVAAVFTVTLSAASTQPVTVAYATANGTATAGSDYQATSSTLTFSPGQTSKTITILVNGDRLGEPNEIFFVNLSGPTNGIIADGRGVGTILDDEPRISIGDVSMAEGRKGKTTLFTFTVTLSAAYDQAVTVSFRTVNGTATTSDGDYVAKTGTLTFAPGETTKTITIEVKGDSKKEANETFYLDLFGNSSNALFTKKRGLGMILNDD
jgi:probable HAF family extracellular repeat protein